MLLSMIRSIFAFSSLSETLINLFFSLFSCSLSFLISLHQLFDGLVSYLSLAPAHALVLQDGVQGIRFLGVETVDPRQVSDHLCWV